MEIRQMATAFLSNGSDMLMMKKAGSRLFDFEFWGGIGGHLEQGELNAPMTASYREIEEETGFKPGDIEHFRLRTILLEVSGGEIWQQFVYFGETKHRHFVPSDEGSYSGSHWMTYWIYMRLFWSKRRLGTIYNSREQKTSGLATFRAEQT